MGVRRDYLFEPCHIDVQTSGGSVGKACQRLWVTALVSGSLS